MILNLEGLKILSQTAIQAARDTGHYIQSRLDETHATQSKVGGSSLAAQVVTEVDIKAQEIILKHLEGSIRQFDLGILTEEAADDQSRLEKDYFWCVDPLDGTLPFTEKRSGYAVSIALVSKAGNPVIGVVYVPDEQICYSAITGLGVYRNGQSFKSDNTSTDRKLNWYLDRSFQAEDHYEAVKAKMLVFAKTQKFDLEIHSTFGAVRNALGVLTVDAGCYFKIPKQQSGGGSIWDFAATRLLFEESRLPVSNAHGAPLFLNNPESTFMNRQGVLMATSKELSGFIEEIMDQIH